MRILQRAQSVLVCRSAVWVLIALFSCVSAAQAQWTTSGSDISNTNTGNVGIGTGGTAPVYKLNIAGSEDKSQIRFGLGPGDSGGFLFSNGPTHAVYSAGASWNGSWFAKGISSSAIQMSAGTITFFTNTALTPNQPFTPSARMYLDGAGNLGLGTTNPADPFHLFNTTNSVGTMRIQGGTTNAGFIGFWNGGPMLLLSNNRHPGNANNFNQSVGGAEIEIGAAGAPADITFSTVSSGAIGTPTEIVRIKSTGRMGIGINNPGFKLDVQGGQINASGGLCINADCKTAWSQVGGGSQWTTSGTTINYSTGNVGIGVPSPTTKLDVDGVVDATGFTINGVAVTGSQWSTSGSTINYSSGNVGVNTSAPSAKLHISGVATSGTAAFTGTNYTSHINYGDGSEDTYLRGGKTTSRVIINDAASGVVLLAQGGGNVGIGTGSPTAKLHVAGTGRFTGDLTVDGNLAAKYQDLAEWVPAAEQLAAGTVVVLDSSKSNQVISSSKSYDTRVAGVISAQPGIMLGEKGDDKVLVATTGRVLVSVDATSGPIEIGDLLVTSDREGVAMKSQPVDIGGVRLHRPGTLIGKALEPLASGTGKILVLLSLQ
jgi:hypothetical protein